jgi:hypothetical protein
MTTVAVLFLSASKTRMRDVTSSAEVTLSVHSLAMKIDRRRQGVPRIRIDGFHNSELITSSPSSPSQRSDFISKCRIGPTQEIPHRIMHDCGAARIDDLVPVNHTVGAHCDILVHHAIEKRACLADACDVRAHPTIIEERCFIVSMHTRHSIGPQKTAKECPRFDER